MRKFLTVAVLASSTASFVHAGTIGPSEKPSILYTFVGAEGGYTWNDINGVTSRSSDAGNLNSIGATSIQNSGGSARVYAGLMRLIYSDSFYFSGDVGWGYYGRSNLTLNFTTYDNSTNLNGSTLNDTFNGFDALVGLVYNQPRYDLFLKAGALLQNSNLNGTLILANQANANNSYGLTTINIKLTLPQVLPEVKVGGSYHVNDKVFVTANYIHAFGFATKFNISSLSCDQQSLSNCIGGTLSTTELDGHINPSLNTVMFGLEYRFA